MADTFTEVTSQSWLERIQQSIKGVLFGLLMFVVAFPLLFSNEGRAVQTARSLDEGAGVVVTVPDDAVDPGRDGQLVHLTGEATTDETLSDPEFGITTNAIKLRRSVEMYQWKETARKVTRKQLGGGTETKTEIHVHQGVVVQDNPLWQLPRPGPQEPRSAPV